jgi:curved DNA-binding protein CbpA
MHTPTLTESLAFFHLSSLQNQTQDTIKTQYHELAKKYHPDKGGSSEQFILLRNCYHTLKKALDGDTFENTTNYGEYGAQNAFKRQAEQYKQAYEKLIKVVDRYEELFNTQIRIINTSSNHINTTISTYENTRKQYNDELTDRLETLEKQYRPGFWKGLLQRHTMTYSEYVQQNNQYVGQFQKHLSDLDSQYLETLVKHYQATMSQIIKTMDTD